MSEIDDNIFFNQFAEPIRLGSEQHSHTLGPLQHPAALMLSSEVVLIVPEQDSPIEGAKDYKIIGVRGVMKHMAGVKALRAELGADFSQDDFLAAVRSVDRFFGEEYDLPGGMRIIGNDEGVSVGRDITPDFDFPNTVSRNHVTILNRDGNLEICDERSTNGTFIFLTPEDKDREVVERDEQPLSAENRDKVFDAFIGLIDEYGERGFEYDDLKGDLGFVSIDDEKSKDGRAIEILIDAATEFPALQPPKGFNRIKITTDRVDEGVQVIYWPEDSKHQNDDFAISKLFVHRQMTQQQADESIKLAAELRSRLSLQEK